MTDPIWDQITEGKRSWMPPELSQEGLEQFQRVVDYLRDCEADGAFCLELSTCHAYGREFVSGVSIKGNVNPGWLTDEE